MRVSMLEHPPPIHIDGRAGRGKTYVLYPVIGALCKRDEIVLLSASSAFAAKKQSWRKKQLIISTESR